MLCQFWICLCNFINLLEIIYAILVTGIEEPKKEFDYDRKKDQNGEYICDICIDEHNDSPVGTGFCWHSTCVECLQYYMDSKKDDSVILCMFTNCKYTFAENSTEIYCVDRNLRGIQNSLCDEIIEISKKEDFALQSQFIPCVTPNCEFYFHVENNVKYPYEVSFFGNFRGNFFNVIYPLKTGPNS